MKAPFHTHIKSRIILPIFLVIGLISSLQGSNKKDFECTEKSNIAFNGGSYETYKITGQSQEINSLEYFYSEDIKNIVKIQGSDPDFYDIIGDLISTNMV